MEKKNDIHTEFSIGFVKKVVMYLQTNRSWDNGCENLRGVADLCADLREWFGLQCSTGGRIIALDD